MSQDGLIAVERLKDRTRHDGVLEEKRMEELDGWICSRGNGWKRRKH
jgi:hypothetical protein